jgi:predicted membrane-bound mannosyltransferase
MSRGAGAGVLVLVLLVHAALALTSLTTHSATYDEGVNVASGYTYIAKADFRLVPVHPPLVKVLCAWPLTLAGARADFSDPSWRLAEPWSFAHRFFYRWNDARRLLSLARLPVVVVTLLLIWAVFLWTRRLAGDASAACAALLCALHPDVVAHGQLATNDLPVAAAFFGAIAAFEWLTERSSPVSWLAQPA